MNTQATVDKVRIAVGRNFYGIGTRVTFADGWTMTFMGPMPKGLAVEQASWHRARGEQSDAR